MASRSPPAIRAIRTSSEVACVALNGRLARLVGMMWQEVRWTKANLLKLSGERCRSVIYRTELDSLLAGAGRPRPPILTGYYLTAIPVFPNLRRQSLPELACPNSFTAPELPSGACRPGHPRPQIVVSKQT